MCVCVRVCVCVCARACCGKHQAGQPGACTRVWETPPHGARTRASAATRCAVHAAPSHTARTTAHRAAQSGAARSSQQWAPARGTWRVHARAAGGHAQHERMVSTPVTRVLQLSCPQLGCLRSQLASAQAPCRAPGAHTPPVANWRLHAGPHFRGGAGLRQLQLATRARRLAQQVCVRPGCAQRTAHTARVSRSAECCSAAAIGTRSVPGPRTRAAGTSRQHARSLPAPPDVRCCRRCACRICSSL
jgi:hypothetical protein